MTDVNLNQTGCLQETVDVFQTTITNVCNGEIYHVANGTVPFIVGSVLLLIVALMVAMLVRIAFDRF